MEYRITVNERQAQILNAALEEYFRLRIGQFDNLADELALIDTDLNPRHPEHKMIFHAFIERKGFARDAFKMAYRIATNTSDHCGINKIPEESDIAYEMHQAVRHALWEANGCEPEWSVWGNRYLPRTDQPMPKVELIPDG